MESTKENIECVNKDGQTKFFSAKQLEHIGKSADGSFDGWNPKGEKPAGIPDKVVIGGSDDKSGGYDPNGGTTVNYVQSGSGDATSTTTDPNAINGSGDAGDAGTSDAKEGTQTTGTGDTAKTEGADNGDAGTGDAGNTSKGDGGDTSKEGGEGDSKEGTKTGEGADDTDDKKPAEKVNKTGNKPGPKPKADKPQE